MNTYRDSYEMIEGLGMVCTHSWVGFTANRLRELYGEKRATAIIGGRDPATNADIAAWLRLGHSKKDAA